MNSLVNNEYLKDTVALKNTLEQGFILLAERLHKISTERMWEGQYGSYEEFLLELGISAPKASKLVSVYKRYILDAKMPTTQLEGIRSWESLYYARNMDAKEAVEQAKLLSEKDVRRWADGSYECDHPPQSEWLHLVRCPKCGITERFYLPPEGPISPVGERNPSNRIGQH